MFHKIIERTSLFLFFFFFIAGLELSSAQSISVSWKNQEFKKCAKDLKKKHGVDLAFDSKRYSKVPIDIKKNYSSVPELMDDLTQIMEVRWELLGGIYLILPLDEVREVKAYRVSGTVVDSLRGERLPGALVFFEPSLRSTTTNSEGFFSLEGAEPGDKFLVFRYLGYKVKRIPLSSSFPLEKKVRMELESGLLDEVEIEENPENTVFKSQEISQISFSQSKMNTFPTMGEVDPFRSVQLLPGIGSTDENISGISIRGGSGDQSLVLYDGFKIFHLDHFFGFVSAFNADAMRRVNIYKGAYPSAYGGGASGIVEMNGKTGDPEKTHGSIGLNLLSAQASLEVPIGKKMTVFMAGRRSYTDLYASPVYKSMMENVLNNNERSNLSGEDKTFEQFNPDFFYYDINGKISFRPNDRDMFSLTLFNSQDRFRINNSDENPDLTFETENRTTWGVNGVGLSWFRNWNEKWFSKSSIGFSNYFSSVDYGALLTDPSSNNFEETVFFSQGNDVVDLSASIENEITLNPKHKLNFGAQIQYNFLGFQVTQDTIETERIREEALQPILYVEDVYRVFQRLLVKTGLRMNHYSLSNQFFFEPRVSANYSLTPSVKLKAAFGVFHQNISRVIRRDVFASNPDFWVLSDGENIPILRSIHYILGTTVSLGKHYKLDVETYLKDNDGLVEYFPAEGIFAINQPGFDPYFSGDGFGVGMDVLFQAQAKHHTGWISYSLSAQREKFEGLNEGDYFPSANDQVHELKLGYVFKKKSWELSVVWIYGSGKPYTAPLGTLEVETPSGDTSEILLVSGINSERLPDYHRLDLALKYNLDFKSSNLQIGFSLFNVYNRKNIKAVRFRRNPNLEEDGSIGGYSPVEVQQLGILPGFSLKFEF